MFFILIIYFNYIIRMPVSRNSKSQRSRRNLKNSSRNSRRSGLGNAKRGGSRRRGGANNNNNGLNRIALVRYTFDPRIISTKLNDFIRSLVPPQRNALSHFGHLDSENSAVDGNKFTLATENLYGSVVFTLDEKTGKITSDLAGPVGNIVNDWVNESENIARIAKFLEDNFVIADSPIY